MSEDDLTFRDQIRPLLLCLLWTNGVLDGIVGWRDVVMTDVRAPVKRVSHFLPLTRLCSLGHWYSTSRYPTGNQKTRRVRTSRSPLKVQTLHKISKLWTTRVLCFCCNIPSVRCYDVYMASTSSHLRHRRPGCRKLSRPLLTTPHLFRSPLAYDSEMLKSDLSDILSAATGLGNSRVSKIVSVRAEQLAYVKPREIFQYFEASWSWPFIVACETLCRRMI